jgi:hypothetical protein
MCSGFERGRVATCSGRLRPDLINKEALGGRFNAGCGMLLGPGLPCPVGWGGFVRVGLQREI